MSDVTGTEPGGCCCATWGGLSALQLESSMSMPSKSRVQRQRARVQRQRERTSSCRRASQLPSNQQTQQGFIGITGSDPQYAHLVVDAHRSLRLALHSGFHLGSVGSQGLGVTL